MQPAAECPKRTVLVLDRDFRPHRVIDWKRAMGHLYSQKIEILKYYNESNSNYEPAVVRLLYRAIPPGKIKQRERFMHRYVFARDNWSCLYCQENTRKNLTIDHVIPRSLGGQDSYENCVTACYDCNQKKANKTLEEANMKLLSQPTTPFMGMLVPRHKAPPELNEYLSTKRSQF